jgi:hypothetical protein
MGFPGNANNFTITFCSPPTAASGLMKHGAFHQFHSQEVRAIGVFDGMNGHYVGMIQRR